MGGEISWQCIKSGNNTGFYVFQVKVYRDCQGVPIDTNMSLTVHNHPSLSSISLTYLGGSDISPICDTINGPNNNFACGNTNTGQGGNGNGAVEEHVYISDTLRILGIPDANGWHFTWSSCCRNAAITNGFANEGFTLRAVMYSYIDSAGTVFPSNNNCFDSSPKFYEKPRTILEVNNGYDPIAFSNGFTYSHNAFDEEMDSINYSWGEPLSDQGYDFTNPNSTALLFSPPYSSSIPINGIIMNNQTGRTFYPANMQGNYVTCTKVSAYKCGQLISEIFREIQIVLIPPTCNLGDTTNGNFGADTLCNVRPLVQPPFFYPASPDPYQWDTLVHCGDTVSFDFIANDNDVYPNGAQQDLLFEISGGQFYDYNNNQPCQNPPCATFQEAITNTDPPFITAGGNGTGIFQWITSCNHLASNCNGTARPTVYTFIIKVSDDFCPAPAIENTSQVISITVFPPCNTIDATIITTDASCLLNDGTATAFPSGGFPPYNLYWFDMAGIPVNPNALSSGNYTVRVTDSTLCEFIDTFSISGPSIFPQISSNINNISCAGGNDGHIDLTSNTFMSFLWNTGDSTEDLTSLTFGTYTVTASDSFGCSISQSFVISEPDSILITANNIIPVNCFGGNNGNIDLNVTGGTAPYSFLWNTTDSTEDLNNLIAGTYFIIVTDANLCTTADSLEITQPNQIINTAIINPVTCNSLLNGDITTFQSGGTPPYSYLWNTNDTTQSLTNIGAGEYVVLVVDSNNCSLSDSIYVEEPDSLIGVINSSNDTIIGIATGGTLPYTYEFWGPNGFIASSTNNLGNVFAVNAITTGVYSFIVTDANNCVDSVAIVYANNFSPVVTVGLSNTSCDSLASLTITVSQDSGEVDMSTALFQSNGGYFDIPNMSVGDTIGTAVLMAGGGTININAYVIVNSIISNAQAIIAPCSPVNGCLGSFTITNSPSGGIEILTQTVPDGNNFTQGNMSSITFENVFVNPCFPLVFTATINSELGDEYVETISFIITILNNRDVNRFELFPNPSNKILTVKFNAINKEDYNLKIVNMFGGVVYVNQLYNFSGLYQEEINVSSFANGSYILIVYSEKGMLYEKFVVLQ